MGLDNLTNDREDLLCAIVVFKNLKDETRIFRIV